MLSVGHFGPSLGALFCLYLDSGMSQESPRVLLLGTYYFILLFLHLYILKFPDLSKRNLNAVSSIKSSVIL